MKVFRKVTPGVNPDIEVHEVLTRAGSEHVAALYGWLDVDDGGRTLQLAMLQQFLRTASDGWDLALASVRSLFADPEMHAQRLRRRLRRRVDPARRGAARGARGPARPLPFRDPPGGRGGRARRDHDRTARGRAGRRTRAGGARRDAAGDVRRRLQARRPGRPADPRRPAPRPDPAHLARLEDRRLRGRAGQAAGRAAAAGLAVARRGRDAAQLRLRRPRGRAVAEHQRRDRRRADRHPRAGVVRAQQEPLPVRLRRRRS